MRTTSWEDFVTKILVERYHAVHLVAGHDHHFGHKNQGSPELLAAKCAELGLGCDIIPKVEIGGITVSSTYIRRLVELGQIERANRFLGHPHTLTQVVRHGRRIGRTIGIPTVNLTVPPHVLVPSHGVYATRVYLPDGACYPAVTNVGTRPTVNSGTWTVSPSLPTLSKSQLFRFHHEKRHSNFYEPPHYRQIIYRSDSLQRLIFLLHILQYVFRQNSRKVDGGATIEVLRFVFLRRSHYLSLCYTM